MLALFGNLSLSELLVIAVIAVLVFGERLPQAAARAYREVMRLRRQLDQMRRESGIDKEFRDIERTFRSTADSARIEDPMNPVVPRKPDYEVQEAGGEEDPAKAPPRFPDYLLEGQERAQRAKEATAEPTEEEQDTGEDGEAHERDAG